MPRWICPSCARVAPIDYSQIGQPRICGCCGGASKVLDTDVTEPVSLFREWQLPEAVMAKRVLAVMYALAWCAFSVLALLGEIKLTELTYWLHVSRGCTSAVAFLLVSWPVRAIATRDGAT